MIGFEEIFPLRGLKIYKYMCSCRTWCPTFTVRRVFNVQKLMLLNTEKVLADFQEFVNGSRMLICNWQVNSSIIY